LSAEILIEKINLFFPAALRPKYAAMVTDMTSEIERLKVERTEWQATILSFRSLLVHAADALENLEVGSFVHGRPLDLIAELRKAAQ
jgi:hypothetical protein